MCLDIIREKWTPTLSLENIAYGFRTLLEEPLAEDALNIGIALDLMRSHTSCKTRYDGSL